MICEILKGVDVYVDVVTFTATWPSTYTRYVAVYVYELFRRKF